MPSTTDPGPVRQDVDGPRGSGRDGLVLGVASVQPPQGHVADPRRAADLPSLGDVVPPSGMLDLTDSIPIADVVWRRRAQVSGKVRSIRVRPWGEVVTLEAVIADATGAVTVAFLGRRRLGGLKLGAPITVEGMVGARDGKLLIMNPAYDLRPLP